MKRFTFIFLIISFSVVMLARGQEPQPIQWFDGSGSFHYGDPLKYVQSVMDSTITDVPFKMAITSVGLIPSGLNIESLRQLGGELRKHDGLAAIYLPDTKKNLKTRSKAILKSMKKSEGEKRGSLSIQGTGVIPQGRYDLIEGFDRNVVIVVPEDPILVTKITTEWTMTSPAVDSIIEKFSQDSKWRKYSRKKILDPTGRVIIDDLLAGNYLVWINQYNMLTYLYRVKITPGSESFLKLDKIFAYKNMRLAQ